MKKNFLLMLVFSASIYTTIYAQTSMAPEIPKNYKPQPKQLVAMPGELTDADIFPVLGKYEYADNEGNVSFVTITRDKNNKGQIWVNGMPEGKFKADLKMSPATYKVLDQKTLQNDDDISAVATTEEENREEAPAASRFSGKSIKEGTLIFDSLSKQLYLNIGATYNYENPSAVFPEMKVVDSVVTEGLEPEQTASDATDKKNKKKQDLKGTTYILTKVIDAAEGNEVPIEQ